ncbi:uncharacterized protein LOC108681623 [Hyalella azteca]|uniref:Uncharacterized protein LOC108681623 n=1 Tax=Hyalella azteca TaxID=294128 RepID=A0A8B7PJ14_HYAAZ|nr:uncharacterized protein LOC108681623 [Hyalella azteca]
MGSGASTPVYPHRIEPPRTFRARQVAPPLQPSYKSTFEDTIAVASQERLLQRSPRHTAAMTSLRPEYRVVARQGSLAPAAPQHNFAFLKERDDSRGVYTVKRGDELFRGNIADTKQEEGFIFQEVSEYVLQSNGLYKLADTGKLLIPKSSAIVRQADVNDHPFAPSSSDTKRMSVQSDDVLQLRNTRNNLERFSSSSSNESSQSAPKMMTHGTDTGLVLTRVKKALEATPPQFLQVPEKEAISRGTSPSPTLRSTIGTNTARAPPNTGYGERIQDRVRRRQSNSKSEKDDSGGPKYTLFHHHSSPELFRGKHKSIFSTDVSRDGSPVAGRRGAATKEQFLSPTVNQALKSLSTGSVTRVNSLQKIDSNFLSPLTGTYSRSGGNLNENSSSDKPSSDRNRVRQKSAVSTISISPSIKSSTPSIGRSAHQTPIKINAHGLVYI